MKAPMTLVAVAVLVLAACSGDHSQSPTAVPISTSPPGSITGSYFLNLNQDAGTRPLDVELQVDGVVLYSGPLFTGSPWDYHVSPLFLSGTVSGLDAGRHTLTLRVIRQENSPERYRVSAHIQVGTQQIAIWDESATLATGSSWTGEFVLGDASGAWDY